MRMRAKKNRDPRMQAVSYLLADITEGKLDYLSTFKNENNAFFLEIGCGKGTFAVELSKRYPSSNILALEKVPDVLLLAIEKAAKAECKNLYFANFDAENSVELLGEDSVDRIYLNFSDPWPKQKNAKRRLTSPGFLEIYKKLLKKNGVIYFKTDNRPLFDYSLKTFESAGYNLENIIFDLHSSPLNDNNIQTEYEKNFSAKGFSINYLEASVK